MLKKIDPLLNADLLYALRAMGHGDELVICDTNFPADAVARADRARGPPAGRRRQRGPARPRHPVGDAARQLRRRGRPAHGDRGQPEGDSTGAGRRSRRRSTGRKARSWPLASIERMAFYERAKTAYCVVQSGETRFYGCFIFKKGVIPPKKG